HTCLASIRNNRLVCRLFVDFSFHKVSSPWGRGATPRLTALSAGENHPPVESFGTTLTAAAWFDSDRISSAFDDVAKTDLFFVNEPGQAHSMRFLLAVNWLLRLCFFHRSNLELCAASDKRPMHLIMAGLPYFVSFRMHSSPRVSLSRPSRLEILTSTMRWSR